jgi:hypothetical protein
VTDTPLLDYLTSLGPAGRDLLEACRDVAGQADLELAILRRRSDRELLDRRVADFFAENPAASANHCARMLTGRGRNDILDSVRRVKGTAA